MRGKQGVRSSEGRNGEPRRAQRVTRDTARQGRTGNFVKIPCHRYYRNREKPKITNPRKDSLSIVGSIVKCTLDSLVITSRLSFR